MNDFEQQMANILLELKEKYFIEGTKAEFEAEGASFDEILMLKRISNIAGVNLSVKIGGCEAMRDLYDLETICPKAIIAPMIESSYAAYKFIKASKDIFQNAEFFIDIETINGIEHLDEILSSLSGEKISGIIIGRSDLVNSINFNTGKNINVDSDTILNYATLGGKLAKKYGKKLIIGGLVTEASIPFFKNLNINSDINFNGFETRKIVFSKSSIEIKNINEGILKALEFELLWLQNRINTNKNTLKDKKRLEDIQNRYYYYKR